MKQPVIEVPVTELTCMTGIEMLDFLSSVGVIKVIYINDKVLIEDVKEEYNV